MRKSNRNPITKIKAKYGVSVDLLGGVSDRMLVCPDGFAVPCNGAPHGVICELAGTTLDKFMRFGGARVNSYHSSIVLESYTVLSEAQIKVAQKLLRSRDFDDLMVAIGDGYERETGRLIRPIDIRRLAERLNNRKAILV